MILRDKWWEEDLSFILEQLVSKVSKDSDNEDYSSKYNYCEDLCKKYSHMINLWMNYGYGDIYSFEDFYNDVKDGYFIDYDGTGRFIDNDTGENIKTIRCDCDWLEKNKPENSDYIMWFNK